MLRINRHSWPQDADFTAFYSDRVHGSLVWRKINRIRVWIHTVQRGKHLSKCIIKRLEPETFTATQARGRHSITNWAIRMVPVLKLKWNQVVHKNSSIIDSKGFDFEEVIDRDYDLLNWEIGQSLENQIIEQLTQQKSILFQSRVPSVGADLWLFMCGRCWREWILVDWVN